MTENGVGEAHGDRTEAASPSLESEALDLVSILSGGPSLQEFGSDHWKQSLLAAVLETLGGFVRLYKGLPSFPELFRPVEVTLEVLMKEVLRSESLKVSIESLRYSSFLTFSSSPLFQSSQESKSSGSMG